MQVYLTNTTGTHFKFWCAELVRAGSGRPMPWVVFVRWGRINTAGQMAEREFSSEALANEFVYEKTNEKLGRGYQRAGPLPNDIHVSNLRAAEEQQRVDEIIAEGSVPPRPIGVGDRVRALGSPRVGVVREIAGAPRRATVYWEATRTTTSQPLAGLILHGVAAPPPEPLPRDQFNLGDLVLHMPSGRVGIVRGFTRTATLGNGWVDMEWLRGGNRHNVTQSAVRVVVAVGNVERDQRINEANLRADLFMALVRRRVGTANTLTEVGAVAASHGAQRYNIGETMSAVAGTVGTMVHRDLGSVLQLEMSEILGAQARRGLTGHSDTARLLREMAALLCPDGNQQTGLFRAGMTVVDRSAPRRNVMVVMHVNDDHTCALVETSNPTVRRVASCNVLVEQLPPNSDGTPPWVVGATSAIEAMGRAAQVAGTDLGRYGSELSAALMASLIEGERAGRETQQQDRGQRFADMMHRGYMVDVQCGSQPPSSHRWVIDSDRDTGRLLNGIGVGRLRYECGACGIARVHRVDNGNIVRTTLETRSASEARVQWYGPDEPVRTRRPPIMVPPERVETVPVVYPDDDRYVPGVAPSRRRRRAPAPAEPTHEVVPVNVRRKIKFD